MRKLLVIGILFSASVFSQEFRRGGDETETRRIRSLFSSAEDSAAAEAVIRSALSTEATRELEAIRTEGSQEVLLDRLRSLESGVLLAPARERLRLEVARRLGEIGTPAAVPSLQKLAATEPSVVAMVPGCRSKVPRPVFDYRLASRRAEFSILERAYHEEFKELDTTERLAWLLETAAQERPSARLKVALEVVVDLSDDMRQGLFEELRAGAEPLAPAAGVLLGQIYVEEEIVPDVGLFRQLSQAAAQRFVREAAGRGSPEFREAVLDVARADARVASLAGFLDSSRGRLKPREYLRKDGASAAAVLGRDKSLEMTFHLAAILSDPEAAVVLRRYAALGLLHQETPAAREAMLQALSSGGLPLTLAVKLERALGQ